MDIHLSDIASREFMPGYHGKLVHGKHLSLAFWEVDQGARVPEHAHKNEQIMQVLEGEFELTVDGISRVYRPGEVVLIPPHSPHSGQAMTSCRIMDVWSPVREEYK